ncbi:hypothetical protein ABK040_006208 [Willaertia magna]
MKIGVLAIGTRGDIQPLLAFALGLQKRLGSESQVYFITNNIYKDFVNEIQSQYFTNNNNLSIIFRGMSGNPKEVMNHPNVQKALRVGDGLKVMQLCRQPGEEMMSKCMKESVDHCKDLNVIIGPSMTLSILWTLSEKFNIPMIYLGLVPEAPTKEFPFCVISPKSLNSEQDNLNTYLQVYTGGFAAQSSGYNEWRRELNLENMNCKFGWLGLKEHFNCPTIYAFSQHVFVKKRPVDWRSSIELSGFLELKLESEQLDKEIIDFLECNKNDALNDNEEIQQQPIFLGFGSMPNPEPFQLLEITERILTFYSKRRVVLAFGWTKDLSDLNIDVKDDYDSSEESDDELIMIDKEKRKEIILNLKKFKEEKRLLIINEPPYRLLFPKCSCIVHHCGAGTIGACLKSGKPQIPVPVFMDQPFWGRKMFELGVASEPIPFKDITSEKIISAISYVLDDDHSKKEKAKEIGELIRKEGDGVDRAVELFLKKMEENFIVKAEYNCLDEINWYNNDN